MIILLELVDRAASSRSKPNRLLSPKYCRKVEYEGLMWHRGFGYLGRRQVAISAPGPCTDSTASFLASDYRGLYHLMRTKPPNKNEDQPTNFIPISLHQNRSLAESKGEETWPNFPL